MLLRLPEVPVCTDKTIIWIYTFNNVQMISYGSERKCYYICDKLCQTKKEKEVLLLQIFRLLC